MGGGTGEAGAEDRRVGAEDRRVGEGQECRLSVAYCRG